MKLITLALAAIFALPSPSPAGTLGAFSTDPAALDWNPKPELTGHPFAFRSSQDPEELKRTNALSTTLTAMNDGVPAGEKIAVYIRKNKIKIRFVEMKTASRLDEDFWNDGKNPVIYLNEALPPYPRVYAPLLAREGAKLLYSDMLDTAERRYMIRSLSVRSWIELGGDHKKLPVIEHLAKHEDKALAVYFKTWLDNDSQTALHKIGSETDTHTIPEVQAEVAKALRDEIPVEFQEFGRKILEALDNDNKRFVDFLIAEGRWKKMYPVK